jgi:hypothetical protein
VKMKVYELLAELKYSVRIKAKSKEAALKHVESWYETWANSADLIGVNDVSVVAVEPVDGENYDEEAAERGE